MDNCESSLLARLKRKFYVAERKKCPGGQSKRNLPQGHDAEQSTSEIHEGPIFADENNQAVRGRRRGRPILTGELNYLNDVRKRTRLGINLDENISRKMFEPFYFGPPTYICTHCHASVWYEERSRKSRRLQNPKFFICCKDGKVQLPPSRQCPPYLQQLLNYNGGPESVTFRQNIRSYNSMFAFTSMGGRVDNSVNNGRGPYVFRLNGQNYHQIGSLLPLDGQAKFAQLYIYDTENEVANRLNVAGISTSMTLDRQTIANLIFMFNEHNELAKAFRMARDRFEESSLQNVSLRLLERREIDGRQYNMPTYSEIAALVIGNGTRTEGYRDIVIEEKTGLLKRINEKHPSFMAMQYPILFPYGEDGYRLNIRYRGVANVEINDDDMVTMREYYAYILQFREGQGNTVLLGGRLFQQFIVDAYCCIEEDRLNWIRNNQRHIRSEVYKGLKDAVTAGDTSALSIGRRMVLPSTFTGGPRYMVQNYQDAMAICRSAGSPDYFITFTCNAKWPEIADCLRAFPGQRPEDRPDIISRVFHIKLLQLLHDIKEKKHFGRINAGMFRNISKYPFFDITYFGIIIAVLYTIEFQKRGLPHAHILLFVRAEDRPKTANDVDRMVTAEFPNVKKDPFAYQSITQFMVHGPCGPENPKCPCMVHGQCSKHYPKNFSNETTFDKNGFPKYRRRDNGRFVLTPSGLKLDNCWVIPHNVDLVVKYQAHINVEICNRAKSVKYLFKYINKGHDRATVVIEENNVTNHNFVKEVDEIKRYLDCRYISASEASWRIFKFDIQYRKPAVERLHFHLPEEQNVIFKDNDSLDELVDRPSVNKTIFIKWMEKNKESEDARNLTYVDFPTKWVWDKKKNEWHKRKKGDTIGRLYFAHPTCGERFYLRMLLNIVKGPTSYDDIRTVNSIRYDSFKSACVARGLLEDDNEWNDALAEAARWASSPLLRDMFVMLLLFCEVSDPLQLWNKNWKFLSEDIEWRMIRQGNYVQNDVTEMQLQRQTLSEIEKIMNNNNRSLKEFPTLPFPAVVSTYDGDNILLREELNYDCSCLIEESKILISSLNYEQRQVFDTINDAVDHSKGGFFFVYGCGGTGKTFLWKTIITYLRGKGKVVLAVASSGIASLLLPGGRTAHSKFKIPLTLDDNSTCNISKQSPLGQLLKSTDLIIWDEAPMMHRNALEAFEKSLRDLMCTNDEDGDGILFGGKTVLLGGDFRQTLPVVQKGSRQLIVAAAISKSSLWSKCRIFILKTNMRLQNSASNSTDVQKIRIFSDWVLNIGDGTVPMISLNDDEEPSWVKIPEEFIIKPGADGLKNIVSSIYPNLEVRLSENDYLRNRCILAPTNDSVEEINSYIISLISGNLKSYLSADSISPASEGMEDQNILYPTEFLNTLKISGLPNHNLQLKVGVPIMLLRNLNQNLGLCNGTRLVVTQLAEKVIEAEIITGNNIGRKVLIPRIVLTSSDTKWPFMLRRRQFPVRVCFSMTINKSQGQTLHNVGIYLPRPVFSHGQLYVAISRTTTPEGVKILIGQTEGGIPGYTKNIVYKEVFDGITGRQLC